MSEHFIEKCKCCKKIISQCRCMSMDKTVIFIICEDCKKTKRLKKPPKDKSYE
jgi:hypothetical protein